MDSVRQNTSESIFAVLSDSESRQERWFTPWLLAFRQLFWLAGFGACAQVLFTLIPPLGKAAGHVIERGADTAVFYLRFIYLYSAGVGLIFLLLRRRSVLPPTHIAVNADELRIYRSGGVVGSGQILRLKWNQLAAIKLQHSVANDAVVFVTKEGKSKLAPEGTSKERKIWAEFFKSVHAHAPEVELDRSLYRLLSHIADAHYTQPWLDNLPAPPQFDNYLPLAPRSLLKNGTYAVREQLTRAMPDRSYTIMQLLRDGNEAAADKDASKRVTYLMKEHPLPVLLRPPDQDAYTNNLRKRAGQLKEISSNNIAAVQDFFVENRRALLVIEQVRGNSLREFVAEQTAVSQERVKEVCLSIFSIVRSLHSLSPPVVHGGLSPDSLICQADSTLRLSDHPMQIANADGFLIGNLPYVAPEQFAGAPCPASDLYSVGAILYFLLCGEDPPPMSELSLPAGDGVVDPVLQKIINLCTQQSLDQRAKDVGELLALLE
ncbi:MAG TPA: protein kinase [Planktothrix sp.]|jgi:serine/threonine protein kinase